MSLIEQGYQTGEVLLPGLEILVKLQPNQFFRFDGIQNLSEHEQLIYNHFHFTKPTSEEDKDEFGQSVFFRGIYEDKYVEVSTMFVAKDGEIPLTFAIGHESTHTLLDFGLKQFLIDGLRLEGFNFDPFEMYPDPELIAHIGGILSLYKRNLHSFFNNAETNPIKEFMLANNSGKRVSFY